MGSYRSPVVGLSAQSTLYNNLPLSYFSPMISRISYRLSSGVGSRVDDLGAANFRRFDLVGFLETGLGIEGARWLLESLGLPATHPG